jgi:hypothetical protein
MTIEPPLESIAPEDEAAVLALNNDHAAEVGAISAARLSGMLAMAFCARRIGRLAAFIIAFDEGAAYDSWNFRWLAARLPRFVYVDRIVVAGAARGRGLARRLYRDLYACARASGHDIIACEVNIEPPNKVSDAFHEAEGFQDIGRALNPTSHKTVRFMTRRLSPTDPIAETRP